jgi:cell division protein FtsZ
VAELARDQGALTVAVVTKPFSFEGAQRRAIAERGLEELEDKVDTLITIPNDRLLQIIDKKTSLLDAFMTCDEILKNGVQGISELITIPGLINVDFADVRAIMKDSGSAMMGIGEASGEKRAEEAAKAAISSPLLELSIDGARGILFTVTGGNNLGMHEVAEAAKIITGSADPDAKVIFGAVINENMKDEIKITVVATGFNDRRKASFEAETSPHQSFSSGVVQKVKDAERTVIGQFQKRPVKKITDFNDIENSEDKDAVGKKNFAASKPCPPDGGEAEDLDIPAFLRKKIM